MHVDTLVKADRLGKPRRARHGEDRPGPLPALRAAFGTGEVPRNITLCSRT